MLSCLSVCQSVWLAVCLYVSRSVRGICMIGTPLHPSAQAIDPTYTCILFTPQAMLHLTRLANAACCWHDEALCTHQTTNQECAMSSGRDCRTDCTEYPQFDILTCWQEEAGCQGGSWREHRPSMSAAQSQSISANIDLIAKLRRQLEERDAEIVSLKVRPCLHLQT